MRSFSFVFISLAFLVSGISLVGISSDNFVWATEPEKATLALNWKPEPEFGGFYEAERIGAYKSEGLKVRILPGGAGQPVVQMVAAGKAEFGISSAEEVIMARSHGADVVALYAVYQTYPMGIMVHESLGLKKLEDVFQAPLTLALEKGLAYVKYLEKKYDLSHLKVVPYTGGVGNFLHDKNFAQQCFVTSEPLEAKKEKSDPQTFLVADSGFNPYTTVLVVRTDFLKRNEALVKKMLAAVKQGWSKYLENPKSANEVMHRLNKGMDLKTFEAGATAQKSLIENADTKAHGVGSMTLDRWKILADQLKDLKLIDKPVDPTTCFKWLD